MQAYRPTQSRYADIMFLKIIRQVEHDCKLFGYLVFTGTFDEVSFELEGLRFLPHDAMQYDSAVELVSLSVCVCLSYAGIVSKRLQCCTDQAGFSVEVSLYLF